MDREKRVHVVAKLLAMTSLGKIRWELQDRMRLRYSRGKPPVLQRPEREANSLLFVAEADGLRFRLQSSLSRIGSERVVLEVMDTGDGTVVDRFSNTAGISILQSLSKAVRSGSNAKLETFLNDGAQS